MRDPLSRVPIRYKLTFGFVGLCLLAYGIGGWLVSSSARNALRDEIVDRLRSSSLSRAAVLDQALATLAERSADFASDGLIRTEAERLAAFPGAPPRDESRRLESHLERNKLPVVPAFVDLLVYASDGRRLAAVRSASPAGADDLVAAAVRAGSPAISAFVSPNDVDAAPCFAVVSPLMDLERKHRVGSIVCWVDASRWIPGVPLAAEDVRGARLRFTIRDGVGGAVEVVPAAAGGASSANSVRSVAAGPGDPPPGGGGEEGRLTYPRPLAAAGWTTVVDLAAREAFDPVAGLESRFLGAGLLIAAATAILLFFPLRFIVVPLTKLRDAAARISKGDFSPRVDVQSKDEVGDLALAFNLMADALQDRTARLEQTAADLAARKDDLAHERDLLDAMVHSMQDALLFFDDHGKVVLSNAAAAPLVKVLGSSSGRDLAVRCANGEPEGAGHPRDCVSCLARGDLAKQSCRLEVGNKVYEVLATRIPSVDGWLGRLLVARDITELATLDERQARQERLAILGEVAAVVAHELNNPLSAIAMYTQMMESELPPDSPFREHVDVVRRNTETCSRTIRGLLDWARSGDPEVSDVDVDEALDEVARFLRPLSKRAQVALERKGTLADPVVRADAVQLRQVLVNLAINAIQAVEGVGARVVVETSEADGGRTVVLDVTDDGPGIPEAVRERIFEPFFTTKPAGKGTGLGLSISRRIVEAHGGTLTLVRSAPGGTTFRIRIPRSAMVPTRRPAPPAAVPAAGPAASVPGTVPDAP